MRYPKFLKLGDTIGITAPSDGVVEEPKLYRLQQAINRIENMGYKVKETNSVRKSSKGRSASSKIQAKELEELFLDDDIKVIYAACGGDFLLEMLSELNFRIIDDNLKWFQGFSDPTGLVHTITTNLDIATIYGDNFINFGMRDLHQSLIDNLEILQGNIMIQESFLQYENMRQKYIIGDENFNLNTPVYWKEINDNKAVEFSGRLIGGCLDVLISLIGTRFDKTNSFINKYQNDGIIWYFDNFALNSEALILAFWQMKESGWLEHINGVIFGRSLLVDSSYNDISFKEAIKHSFAKIDVPIILEADIGHVSPRMTIINGAYATVKVDKGKGIIKQILKE